MDTEAEDFKTGRKRRERGPKGRPLDENALGEIRALLGDRPRRRDLLIEFLHLIQDRWGFLSAARLRALAEEMRLSQAEVYEVASFYDHFDVVKEGEAAPPALTIRVCGSISCALAGADALIHSLRAGVDPKAVRVLHAPCMGRCAGAPAARVGNREVDRATSEEVLALASAGETKVRVPLYTALDAYRRAGGYRLLAKVRTGALRDDDVIDAVEEAGLRGSASPVADVIDAVGKAGLRGLGGAGFPAGRKWEIVRSYPRPRLMTVNGDEGEPGTFKDRHHLERDPHRMLEGAMIAAHAVEAERIYVYMRDEYPAVLEILRREIAALEDAGLAAPGFIELRRGAGAYICGEESAMIESIEGKRGYPRHRPPYVAEVGLFGRPTLNHNVETLWWVREIVEKGADAFAAQGKPGHPGLRSWSVSGRVADPGVKLAPAGITARELIDGYCGGMAPGHVFKAYLPGGASGGILPASMADVRLDFGGELQNLGALVGSHAIVVLSDKDNIKAATLNLLEFFRDESCGQCTPCREGTAKLTALLSAPGAMDEAAIRDLEAVMRDASICGLGQAAPNPVNHLLTYFRQDL